MTQQLGLFPDKLAIARPRPLPRTAPGGRQYAFTEQIDRHLLDRTQLTLLRIANAHKTAEQGWVEEMADLFETRIEADAHLRSAFDNRNESVSLKPYTVVEGGDEPADKEAAAELDKRLRLVPNMTDTFAHQLQFVPFGWSASEIQWGIVDGMAAPVFFDNVPHRRFAFDRETDDIRLRTTEDPSDGVPFTPGKWWTTCRGRGRLVATSGLMRTAVWWSTFKTMSVRDWLVLSDRFGIPFVTGEYEEVISDDDKEILRQAVQDLGTDGWAIFSQHAKMEIHEIQRNQTGNVAEGIHGALMTICDQQLSKLIEGATLVSEVQGPGSHALGTVHENRYHDILEGDGNKLGESFQATIGKFFVEFNGLGAKPPRLKMHLRLNQSLDARIDMAVKIANNFPGFVFDEEQLRQETLFHAPRPGTTGLMGIEVAKMMQAAATAEAMAEAPEPPEDEEPPGE